MIMNDTYDSQISKDVCPFEEAENTSTFHCLLALKKYSLQMAFQIILYYQK